jgi:hypothetical protein
MVKHNNVVPNGHFKKHWQNYVKTWFNQPARKKRRRIGNAIEHAYFLLFSLLRMKNFACPTCSFSSIMPFLPERLTMFVQLVKKRL